MQRILLAVLMVIPALAGCLAGDEGAGGIDSSANAGLTATDDPIPHGGDHNHSYIHQHQHAENARLVAQDNLYQYGKADDILVPGAHAMDIHGDILVAAVFGNHDDSGGQQGFHIFDISDPDRLQHLAFWEAGTAVRGDRTIAISPDGEYVFLGFEGGDRPGIAAVSITDPSAPEEVAFWSDACFQSDEAARSAGCYGPHTVSAGEVDGVTYVFALAAGVTILSFDGEQFQQVGKYTTQDQAALADAPQHVDPDDPDDGYAATYGLRAVYAHDSNFYLDPLTGIPLLLVAYAYDGMKMLDISNPSAPVLIGRWLPPQDSDHRHYTHSINAERYPTGELIVVVGTETFEEGNRDFPSPLWVLDATAVVEGDPLQNPPIYQGRWANPSEAPSGELTISVHFFRQQDGLLYLSHYHGGVWVIDLRTEEARMEPAHVAYIMPISEAPITPPETCCFGWPLAAAPMVFDVEVAENGMVYSADIIQGVSAIAIDIPE